MKHKIPAVRKKNEESKFLKLNRILPKNFRGFFFRSSAEFLPFSSAEFFGEFLRASAKFSFEEFPVDEIKKINASEITHKEITRTGNL